MNILFNRTAMIGVFALAACTSNVNHSFDGDIGVDIGGSVVFGADFYEDERSPLAAAIELTVQTGVPSYVAQGAIAYEFTGGDLHMVERREDAVCITTDFENLDGLAPVSQGEVYDWTLCMNTHGGGTLSAHDESGAVLNDGADWDFTVLPHEDTTSISHREDGRALVEDLDLIMGSEFDRNPHGRSLLLAVRDDAQPADPLPDLDDSIFLFVSCLYAKWTGDTDTPYYQENCVSMGLGSR